MKRTVPFALLLLILGSLSAGCNMPGATPTAPGAGELPASDQATGDYTILLQTFERTPQGPPHAYLAEQWKKSLSEKLGWKGLTVVTSADHSELYWGRFPTIEAARPSLKKAKDHRTPQKTAPFERAYITTSPGVNPGPPEWDLRNCKGAYTLVVADFQDVPKEDYTGRKEKAVAYCGELRQKGHDAYYHHGPSSSQVTIGSFGPEAVRAETVLVPQPGGARPVKAERRVVADPKLIALKKDPFFHYRTWNGRQTFNVVKDASGKEASRTPVESYVAEVPEKADAAATINPIGDRQPRQAP
jgi:hypothetical protein